MGAWSGNEKISPPLLHNCNKGAKKSSSSAVFTNEKKSYLGNDKCEEYEVHV